MQQVGKIAGRALLGLVLLAAMRGTPARAQQTKEAALVNAVLDYRAHWVGDSTVVDACSVYSALGRPANFPAGIDTSLIRLLDRVREPCANDSARAVFRWPRYFVSVDSISIGGASGGARVSVRVVKHEYSYRERYTLRAWPNGAGGRGVSVAEVRTWGFTQSLPVRPVRFPRRP